MRRATVCRTAQLMHTAGRMKSSAPVRTYARTMRGNGGAITLKTSSMHTAKRLSLALSHAGIIMIQIQAMLRLLSRYRERTLRSPNPHMARRTSSPRRSARTTATWGTAGTVFSAIFILGNSVIPPIIKTHLHRHPLKKSKLRSGRLLQAMA